MATRTLSKATTVAVVAAVAVGGLVIAPRSTPTVEAIAAVVDSDAAHVTADALPTVQINGVVWDQTIVGNKVVRRRRLHLARPTGFAARHQRDAADEHARVRHHHRAAGHDVQRIAQLVGDDRHLLPGRIEDLRRRHVHHRQRHQPPTYRSARPRHRCRDLRLQRHGRLPRERARAPPTRRSTRAVRSTPGPPGIRGRSWLRSRRPPAPCSRGPRSPTTRSAQW